MNETLPQSELPVSVAVGAGSSTEARPRILVAEDDIPLGKFLRRQLQAQSYHVDLALDGELAYAALAEGNYQLLVVDAELSKIDGIALVRQLRTCMPQLPILTLAEQAQIEHRVLSLDSGADDCLSKPFSFSELSARVRALLRRHLGTQSHILKVHDVTLDRKAFRVERAGVPISLTTKEFALLEFLMSHVGETVSRAMIMENVWNTPWDPSTNLVDVYVKYVRDKVDAEGFGTKLIRTVRGVGYVFSYY